MSPDPRSNSAKSIKPLQPSAFAFPVTRDFWSFPHGVIVDAPDKDIPALKALAGKSCPGGYDWQFSSSTEAEFRFDVQEEGVFFAMMTYGGLNWGLDEL
jgi:hypothetical protein